MPAPSVDYYIFSSCTNPSLTGVCNTDSDVIVGYDIFTYSISGCMSNTLIVDSPSNENTAELNIYDTCNECLTGDTVFGFVDCCFSGITNYTIPNSAVTAYTLYSVYVMDGTCYELRPFISGYPIIGQWSGSSTPTDCVTCISANPCVSRTPTPTPTLTPTPSPLPTNYQFSACCDGSLYYTIGLPINLTVGNVYYIESNLFSGCTTVITYSGTGTLLSVTSTTLSDSCATCETGYPCPTPSETPTSTVTPTPTVTPTNTVTPTITPTNTQTPTVTPTPSVSPTSSVTPTITPTSTITPSVTTTPTPSPVPTDYQFRSCCDPTNVFIIDDYVGTLTSGEIYYITGSGFTGCAEVIPFTGFGIRYSASTLTGPYNDCGTCLDTYPCYCVCKNYELFNNQTVDVYISFIDCYGFERTVTLASASSVELCACEDSILVPPGVEINILGDCTYESPTPTPTPTITPTVSPSPVYTECSSGFCLTTAFEEFSDYDGYYTTGGTANGRPYYTGSTSGTVYYDGVQWCLSATLSGSCILYGKTPCFSNCPDFDEEMWSSGICPTPTPTPTPNVCLTVDFNALFDCDYTPEITVTCETPTPTPSVTPTINPCSFVDAVIYISDTSPTPTPTPTTTPTPSIQRNVNISGSTTYTIIDNEFQCVFVREITDCETNETYYVSQGIRTSSNDIVTTGETFSAYVDGVYRCFTYVGIKYNQSPTLTLNTINNSYSACTNCLNALSPTPTPTPTVTPTKTVTPTVSPSITPSSSVSPTPTVTPTTSVTPTRTVTPTPSINSSPTPTKTPTVTPTNTPTSSPTPTPSATVTKTPTLTPTKTPTSTPTVTPTNTITPTKTSTPTPTKTPAPAKFIVESCTDDRIAYVSNNGLLSVNIGDYVRLIGTGYSGCWVVTNYFLGTTATSIVSVHADCNCN
jgi:hypothetical protein